MSLKTTKLTFKPRARLLLLLGDQLIRDAGVAAFELVKNAYDADSRSAIITMSRVEEPDLGMITVQDSGTGMDYSTVTSVWLEPGTDFRAKQRQQGERTPKYSRLPLGEKGVGRFAAHKLGKRVRLITRKKAGPEIVVDIDWERDFENKKYLSDVRISVQERKPELFTGLKTGTRIEITKLRNEWTRSMVRQLARAINGICSPFEGKEDFKAQLCLTNKQDWLSGILRVEDVLKYSVFRASCDIVNNKLSYSYSFHPFPIMQKKVQRRTETRTGSRAVPMSLDNRGINLADYVIGPIHLDLYIFDREPQMLELGNISDKKGLKDYLDENGGVRVYRSGIRVYDYGEQGNDWLELNWRRFNVPGKHISNNLVIGAVSLQLEHSIDLERERGLIEKTNREGFVDNDDFRAFRDAVFFAFTAIEHERNIDKTRIRNAYRKNNRKEPVVEDIAALRTLARKKKLVDDIGPYLDRIERDYLLIRDRFLTSASAGLSLSVVIHEVEKGVAELVQAVTREKSSPRLKRLAQHLADLIEGFASLAQQSGVGKLKASSLISQAVFNTDLRLQVHGITRTIGIADDFQIRASRRLLVSTLMNLIDNSIWWLDNKWGEREKVKRIYIGTSREFDDGPAIIVADNGPGFIDPPEYLIEPFISRKPHGMGLGLHIADQVMKTQGGHLAFPARTEVPLPKGFDGAVVALVFGETSK
jgi:signal transduction histidine kinase